MLGLRFEVVRPRDWMGTLALLFVRAVAFVLCLAAILGRLPNSWQVAVGGHTWLIRAVLFVLVVVASGAVLRLACILIPTSPLLWRNHIHWRVGGRTYRRRLPLSELASVGIEERVSPPQEVIVLDLKDGAHFDLCPITWDGAPGLFRALERFLRRSDAGASKNQEVPKGAEQQPQPQGD